MALWRVSVPGSCGHRTLLWIIKSGGTCWHMMPGHHHLSPGATCQGGWWCQDATRVMWTQTHSLIFLAVFWSICIIYIFLQQKRQILKLFSAHLVQSEQNRRKIVLTFSYTYLISLPRAKSFMEIKSVENKKLNVPISVKILARGGDKSYSCQVFTSR